MERIRVTSAINAHAKTELTAVERVAATLPDPTIEPEKRRLEAEKILAAHLKNVLRATLSGDRALLAEYAAMSTEARKEEVENIVKEIVQELLMDSGLAPILLDEVVAKSQPGVVELELDMVYKKYPSVESIVRPLTDILKEVDLVEAQVKNPRYDSLRSMLSAKLTGLTERLKQFFAQEEEMLSKLMDAGLNPDELLDIRHLIQRVKSSLVWRPNLMPQQPKRAEASASENTEKFGAFADILEIPIHDIINHIVTNDYEPNNVSLWRTATTERARRLKEKGGWYKVYGEMLETVLYGYAFELFKKGGSIDMDHLTINWETAKARLANEKSMINYASFRRSELYPYADLFARVANLVMQDAGGRWFGAGSNWNNGFEMMVRIKEILISDFPKKEPEVENNGDLLALLSSSDFSDFRKFKKDLERECGGDSESMLIFVMHLGHYETCLRDYRSKIAIEKLGVKRSAVKHKTGITAVGAEQPQAWLSKISYKVGKNNDKGKYATALGWVSLSDDLRVPAGPSDKVQPQRFKTREEESYEYLKFLFGSDRAAKEMVGERQADGKYKGGKRWYPESWEDCYLHVDEALELSMQYWYKKDVGSEPQMLDLKDKKVRDKFVKTFDSKTNMAEVEGIGIRKVYREADLNFEHYEATWGALISLYDLASTCWAKSIEHDLSQLNMTDFTNRINEEIGKIGTQAAIALSYLSKLPEEEPWGKKRAAIFESIRASMDMYIVYLLSQIEIPEGLMAKNIPYVRREYEERYDVARREMLSYLENNGSLWKAARYSYPTGTNSAGRTVYETRMLGPMLMETVESSSFKRIPHSDPNHARTVYNTGKSRREGHKDLVLNMSVAELISTPKWPYIQKSNTAVNEDK